MAQHAKLSPSAAHRWMNCAGSVALIGDEPSTAGQAAMMGTAAHAVIQTMLDNGETDAALYHNRTILVHSPGKEPTVILEPGQTFGIAEGWFLFVCDDAMVNGVQTMIDEVERIRDELFDPILYTERFLDMSWLDDRLGGTADVTLVELAGWIHLLDYKNGRVLVEVNDNEQMKNYAVGLLHEHPDALGVVVHLVQPNAIHEEGCIREAIYTADEIRLFEITLKAAADATSKPNAPLRAGEWCQYCQAKTRCPAFDALALNEAGADFADDPVEPLVVPMLVEADDVGTALETYAQPDEYRAALVRKAKWIPILDQWARDIRARIQAELLNQQPVGDWKLVRSRSNRKWRGENRDFAKELSSKAEIAIELLYTDPELKSPAQVEKLGSGKEHKAHVKKVVGEMAYKPEGKISIAPGSDARDAIDPATVAAADFADDPAEDFES